ncbi:MAG: hypothetical protein JW704_02515 [Anaerolineaceae bacterium]|nr:hypothetical protein [Anaerolineaceae bacterium]
MGSALHTDLPVGEIHIIHNWSYADQSAREAATGFTESDLLKWAYQESDGSYWVLTGYSPIEWIQVGGGSGAVPSTDVTVPVIGTPTYGDLQDYLNNTGSASIISGFDITDSGAGQIDVAAGKVLIRTTDSELGVLAQYDYAGATDLSLTDNALNWVYIRYNSGSPDVQVTTDLTSINFHDEVIIGKVYRAGTTLHILQSGMQFPDYSLKNSVRLWEVYGTQRATGMVTTETGTRNIAITAGAFYVGHNRFAPPALDTSGSDTFSYWYNNGAWVEVPSQTQISNTQYNDYGTGLAALTSNRYGLAWVYLQEDGDLDVVYGQGDYLLAAARAAGLPANLPPEVTTTGILIAKIIIQQGASVFTDITLPFNTQITFSGVTDHGALGGLGDDDHPQYLLVGGSRAMSGSLNMGSFAITNVGNVDGVDVSTLASTVSSHIGNTSNPHSVTASQAGAVAVPGGSAHGDILFRNSSGWTRLPAGTSGYKLQTNGAGADPTWVAVAAGDVVGPASATDNAIVRFNATTGKLVQNSSVTIDDDGNLVFASGDEIRWGAVRGLTYSGTTLYVGQDTGGDATNIVDLEATTAVTFSINGADVAQIDADGLELNNSNVYEARTVTFNSVPTVTPSSGTATCEFDLYQKIIVNLNSVGTVTIQLNEPVGPGNFMLVVLQGGTPTTTLNWSIEGSHALWAPGGAMEVASGASTRTIIGLFYDGSTWYATSVEVEQVLAS